MTKCSDQHHATLKRDPRAWRALPLVGTQLAYDPYRPGLRLELRRHSGGHHAGRNGLGERRIERLHGRLRCLAAGLPSVPTAALLALAAAILIVLALTPLRVLPLILPAPASIAGCGLSRSA